MANTVDEQLRTMIDNMPEKTGKSLEQWFELIRSKGLSAHGEILKLLKGEHGVTHGFANTVALLYRQQAEGGPSSDDDLVESQYAGAKAGLRPLYEDIVKAVSSLGGDVEIAPKKTYVSLRRSKQFGLVQASTKDRIDLGLILKGVDTDGRLEDGVKWNGMCTHRVRLNSKADFDQEVQSWLRQAYEGAG